MSRPALLAAVAADPDADLPRLLLADWLDDHGESDRAEFVRLQVEWAGTARRLVGEGLANQLRAVDVR